MFYALIATILALAPGNRVTGQIDFGANLGPKLGPTGPIFDSLAAEGQLNQTRFMERAMGIEPTSEAWEVLNIPIPFSSQRDARPPRV